MQKNAKTQQNIGSNMKAVIEYRVTSISLIRPMAVFILLLIIECGLATKML